MAKVKVKAKARLFEAETGQMEIGEIYEISAERAKSLGDSVEILKKKPKKEEKETKKAADKQVKKAKSKGV